MAIKLVPVSVKALAWPSAITLAGLTLASVGAGGGTMAFTVKATLADVPPPGAGLVTLMLMVVACGAAAVPLGITKFAGITAVSWPGETHVVTSLVVVPAGLLGFVTVA